jgi:hypothetical protein
VKRSAGKPEREQTGHSPNNRCSGPVLLSFWLHVASAGATKMPAPSQGSGRTGH